MTQVGDIIGDKYRLTGKLGQGGMGEVFVAEHTVLGKQVAIKLLHAHYATYEDAVRRFYREAQAAAAVGHRGIVEVHDVGQTDAGAPYIVMELLRGESLGELLDRRSRLDVDLAVELLVQTLAALGAVHGKGIIHRDLKPENIFLSTNDDDESFEVKLLDFGISKVTGRATAALTMTGLVMGTPHYMAPEQARGVKDVDFRVDVWATGAILYRVLTGRLPIEGETYAEVVAHILEEPIVPPRTARPELSEALEQVMQKALAKDRDERFGSAAELREALLPFRPAPGDSPRLPGQTLMRDAEDDRATMAPGSGELPTAAAEQDSIETAAALEPASTTPAPQMGTLESGGGALDVPPTLFTPPDGQATVVTPPEGQPMTEAGEPAAVPLPAMGATPTAAPTVHYRDPTPPWEKAKTTPDTFAVAVKSGAEPSRAKATWIVPGAALLLLLLGGGSIAVWAVWSSRSVEPGPTAALTPEPLGPVATGQPTLPPAPLPVPLPLATPPTEVAPTAVDAGEGAASTAGDAGDGMDPGATDPPPSRADAPPREGPSKGSTRSLPPRPLSDREVRAALAPQRSALRRCIGLVRPAPTVVRMRISVDGAGVGRYERAAPAPPANVTACLQRTIARTRFRASGGERISVVIPVRRAQQEERTTDTPGTPLRPSPFGS